MAKKHFYTELSSVKCNVPGCRKFLKLNVTERIPRANKCYEHYMELVKKRPIVKTHIHTQTVQQKFATKGFSTSNTPPKKDFKNSA